MREFDEGYQYEGLDRVDTILSLMENRLGYPSDEVHDSIYDERAKELLLKANEALCELYQHIGNWEENEKEEAL